MLQIQKSYQKTISIGDFPIKRYLVILLLSTSFLLFILGDAHSQTRRIENSKDIFSDIAVCNSYESFLKGEIIGSIDDCDEMSRFLIQSKDIDPAKFAIEYRTRFPAGSNFEILLEAMENVIFSRMAEAFAALEIAGSHLYGAFYNTGDIERANIYSILVGRIKLEILSSELSEGSELLSAFPIVDFEGSFGPEFRILGGRRPDFRLLCFLKSDNLRVPAKQVVASEHLRICIEEYIPEEK